MQKISLIAAALCMSSPAFARHVHCAPAPDIGSDLVGAAILATFGIAWFALRSGKSSTGRTLTDEGSAGRLA